MEENTNKQEKKPWEMEKSLVEVLESYDCKINREEGDYYQIEFYDMEGQLVESDFEKKRFEGMPYQAKIDTEFWVVIYKIKGGETQVSTWPVADYWHESWKERIE